MSVAAYLQTLQLTRCLMHCWLPTATRGRNLAGGCKRRPRKRSSRFAHFCTCASRFHTLCGLFPGFFPPFDSNFCSKLNRPSSQQECATRFTEPALYRNLVTISSFTKAHPARESREVSPWSLPHGCALLASFVLHVIARLRAMDLLCLGRHSGNGAGP